MKIGILGGTGDEGRGLGFRWAAAGHDVYIGSRSNERGRGAADDLNALLPEGAPRVRGGDNLEATLVSDVIVLSVPYKAMQPTLADIAAGLPGKVLVSVVVPLQPPKVSHVWHPPAGSAAQEAKAQVGDEVRVVAAFQNVSAELLMDLNQDVHCDVLICGDDKEAKLLVKELAQDGGMVGIDAGPLKNAGVVEGMTSILIGINIRNKIKHSGIKITGILEST